jgi:diguanylate cyclase (GGDEF)-like protein/PAS domain S-box-containing protein
VQDDRDRARDILEAAGAIIVGLDPVGTVTLVNRAACALLGRAEAELTGEDFFDVAVPDDDRPAARLAFAALMAGAAGPDGTHVEHAVTGGDGARRTVAWTYSAVREDGALSGAVAAGQDTTERCRQEEQIAHLAYHDALTGLPNRTLLREHLRLALARSRRTSAGIALLHLDVDGFRLVNDSLGHAAGDELLSRLAVRVREATRATDLLARPGGDELLLLLADLREDPVTVAQRVAGEIAAALQEPFLVDGTEFQVGVSIGISVHPRDARDAEDLLNHADAAMYRAKALARGGCAVYATAAVDPLERLSMSARLRRALARDELRLHYQPIFGIGHGELVGVEALLRWHDPERGRLVPPGDFIPLAEETGLIEAIGDWVVRAVCEQQVRWAQLGLRPQISFNVSPRQLRRLDFCERVRRHLAATGADPSRLTVELTESATLQDPAQTEPILRELHELGLGLALDDFGSGYSSLSRLIELPVGTLKIDRSFLREVPESHEASAVVTAILRLGRALGRHTVAEGVETEAQHRFLAEQRCSLAQGFLLGRPLPPEEVEALLPRAAVG